MNARQVACRTGFPLVSHSHNWDTVCDRFRQNKVGILVSPTRLETLPRDHRGVVSLLGLGLSLRLGGFFSEEHVCGFDHRSAFLG